MHEQEVTVKINGIPLGKNKVGLTQYTGIVQVDFFADSPQDAYRYLWDKLAEMYNEDDVNKGMPMLKAIVGLRNSDGTSVIKWDNGKVGFLNT